MSSFYYGVLNTGRRRYAHPALTGTLPQPWLPAKKQSPAFGEGAAGRRGVVLSLRRKMAKKLKRQQSREGYQSLQNGAADDGESGGLPDGWTVGNSMNIETGDEQRGAAERSPPPDGQRSQSRSQSQPRSGSAGGGSGGFWGSANPWSDPPPSTSSSSPAADFGGQTRPANANRRQVSFDALPERNVWGDDGDDDDEDEDEDEDEGARRDGGSDEPAESPVSLSCACCDPIMKKLTLTSPVHVLPPS